MTDAMKPIPLTLVVAATTSNAIGRSYSLPWRLSKEMAYFARVTKGENSQRDGMNAVIMGRKSWEGIPAKFRPLPERVNVVVSRQKGYDLGAAPQTTLASSLPAAVTSLQSSSPNLHRTFLIGGAQLYNLALTEPASSTSPYFADRILLTRILTDYPHCDTFLHDFASDVDSEGKKTWRRASHAELREWAGWDVPEGKQTEKDKMVKEREKLVDYEYQMWVR